MYPSALARHGTVAAVHHPGRGVRSDPPRKYGYLGRVPQPRYMSPGEGTPAKVHVSPQPSGSRDGDRGSPPKKRPSSQLLLPGEGTQAKVCVSPQLLLPGEGTPAKGRVSPQDSGSRDVDSATACVSPQTLVSRNDDTANGL